MTQKFQARELETRERRRKELLDVIKEKVTLLHDEDAIILMTLNHGYNYLFLN